MALPVSIEEAKRQLKIELDETNQDAEIVDFIRDAADWVERYTGHILEARDVVEHFRGFSPVALRAWPILDTSEPVVDYTPGGGVPTTLDAVLDMTTRPARVLPASGVFWPFIDSQQAFTVTIRAGYEAPDDVPRGLCRAMLVLIGAYDADREGGDILAKAEEAARRLCQRYKRHTL
ncbi:MAG: DNA packaging protein [Novosphingobium sp. 17-62-19]|uniref:phage head-tail connector protein n=1 Tax=Novosphingobium sp. 17-62-19 TaxID=1970406 RepID=UPI000BCB15B0|nr:phage head-tail connector protein [Novosphingobium sp. 17-62-19]OZA21371.1 MAG: DNA packaging protein [Novosphingobium sp. 17-62-19]OZA67311.1 MAG: DNA packaging protein [Sphingomonadales bacterium 39-62-4]HQS95084.1 phage gp6-like head-tail connector protein [Novosphingobium sp.]